MLFCSGYLPFLDHLLFAIKTDKIITFILSVVKAMSKQKSRMCKAFGSRSFWIFTTVRRGSYRTVGKGNFALCIFIVEYQLADRGQSDIARKGIFDAYDVRRDGRFNLGFFKA